MTKRKAETVAVRLLCTYVGEETKGPGEIVEVSPEEAARLVSLRAGEIVGK